MKKEKKFTTSQNIVYWLVWLVVTLGLVWLLKIICLGLIK
jgi:hypothetical protein